MFFYTNIKTSKRRRFTLTFQTTVHHRRSLQRKRVESEHGAHSLGPLASAGEFQLQRIGGVHSSGPLENSQDRPRRHWPPFYCGNASAPEPLRPRPCTYRFHIFFPFCLLFWLFLFRGKWSPHFSVETNRGFVGFFIFIFVLLGCWRLFGWVELIELILLGWFVLQNSPDSMLSIWPCCTSVSKEEFQLIYVGIGMGIWSFPGMTFLFFLLEMTWSFVAHLSQFSIDSCGIWKWEIFRFAGNW